MIVTALTLLFAAQAAAHGEDYPPCDQEKADQGIQSAMNICAYNDYRKADADLNATWKDAAANAKVIDADAGTSQFAELLASQRAWLAYRDAQCELETNRYLGGSILPLVRANCLTSMTEKRTAELNKYLEFPN